MFLFFFILANRVRTQHEIDPDPVDQNEPDPKGTGSETVLDSDSIAESCIGIRIFVLKNALQN